MSPDDGRERLLGAVEALAVSTETLQARLEVAGLTLLPLRPEDFNEPHDAELFATIRETLTAVQDEGSERGDLVATTSTMSDEAALQVAKQIVVLHRRVYRW